MAAASSGGGGRRVRLRAAVATVYRASAPKHPAYEKYHTTHAILLVGWWDENKLKKTNPFTSLFLRPPSSRELFQKAGSELPQQQPGACLQERTSCCCVHAAKQRNRMSSSPPQGNPPHPPTTAPPEEKPSELSATIVA